MKILVINCGSSSLKFQLIDSVHGQVLAKGLCERIGIEGSRLVYRREGAKEQTVKAPMTEHKTAVKMVLDALTAPGTGS